MSRELAQEAAGGAPGGAQRAAGGGAGGLLHQLTGYDPLRAQLDDAAGDPALFEAACRDLWEIRAACLLALGMKP